MTALIVTLLIEKTIGLRVSAERETAGLDVEQPATGLPSGALATADMPAK